MSDGPQQKLEAGQVAAIDLAAGDRLRICTPSAHQGGDMSFAGFDQALTRNINGWERFKELYLVFHLAQGMRMYDGDGEPVIELAELHSIGAVDIMLPGCWRELYPDGRPGCRDLIAQALGIARGELMGMASFFVSSHVTDEWYDPYSTPGIGAGDHMVLDALRPVRLAVSACPDVELPGWRPGTLQLERLP